MKETLRTSFRLGSAPLKVAKGIQRKMLRNSFKEALVEIPNTDVTLLIPATAKLEDIEAVVKAEQLKLRQ